METRVICRAVIDLCVLADRYYLDCATRARWHQERFSVTLVTAASGQIIKMKGIECVRPLPSCHLFLKLLQLFTGPILEHLRHDGNIVSLRCRNFVCSGTRCSKIGRCGTSLHQRSNDHESNLNRLNFLSVDYWLMMLNRFWFLMTTTTTIFRPIRNKSIRNKIIQLVSPWIVETKQFAGVTSWNNLRHKRQETNNRLVFFKKMLSSPRKTKKLTLYPPGRGKRQENNENGRHQPVIEGAATKKRTKATWTDTNIFLSTQNYLRLLLFPWFQFPSALFEPPHCHFFVSPSHWLPKLAHILFNFWQFQSFPSHFYIFGL